jgi:hypothetical protein
MRRLLPFTLLLAAAPASAAPPDEGVEFFEKRIRPVLVERCYPCHSDAAPKVKGGLKLDTRAATRKGGERGPALVPGDPDRSLLVAAVRYADEALQMPPKAKLSDAEIATLETWVRMGAPDPRTAAVATAPARTSPADFWSLRPVRDPPVPAVRNSAWPQNDVDRFLLAALEAKGLRPVAAADKRTLIRRATFDLTGLPPTPEEVEAFRTDDSPGAFARVVDRLLASPAYGERWGRHWLDCVRYADTTGCNSDFPVPSAYRYRDYVIQSFNADKPYDQFLREQIAGDLLPAANDAERQEHIVATGYLAIARRFGSAAAEFHLTVEDLIDNLGKTVLGLSLGCARCHDHKFDPVPQTDYYALYGIFASTRYAFPGTELFPHTKDFVALGSPADAAALRAYEQELSALDRRVDQLRDEKRPLAIAAAAGLPPPSGGKRTLKEVEEEWDRVHARMKEMGEKPPAVAKAYAVLEGTPVDAKVQVKGDPKKLGDVVPRSFLTALGGQKLPPEEKGSGRLELAGWLTDPQNPLTARVMVNRIWQHHFGAGLVRTPNDFGLRGERPTHPELLDWLTRRFLDGGWSVKQMHRLVMLSRAYQLASADDPADAARDVRDDYLWHFPRRRLSAEEVRDAMLAVSGALDRSPAGPHPFPPEGGWQYTQHKPFVAAYEHDRRGAYLMQQRIRKQPFLEVFDGADPNAPTGDRPLTTTALQALLLL